MKIFVFAASTSSSSINEKLIQLVIKKLSEKGINVDHHRFREFELPLYDADLNKQGMPENAQKFIRFMRSADASIIASPEYNLSIPGTLKNLIDWVSRDDQQPFKNHWLMLCSASPSLVGGNRGLWATRMPLEALSAHVYPDMFSLAAAHQAFDDHGELKDSMLDQRLEQDLEGFVNTVKRHRTESR